MVGVASGIRLEVFIIVRFCRLDAQLVDVLFARGHQFLPLVVGVAPYDLLLALDLNECTFHVGQFKCFRYPSKLHGRPSLRFSADAGGYFLFAAKHYFYCESSVLLSGLILLANSLSVFAGLRIQAQNEVRF